MQSVFVIITRLIASKFIFEKNYFVIILAAMVEWRGGKNAWKGGVRWLRPKIWQRAKCTLKCARLSTLDFQTLTKGSSTGLTERRLRDRKSKHIL